MLRLLLLHVRGATSFEDLKTVNGNLCSTFEEAATRLNLISDDTEYEKSMDEANFLKTPFELRLLFVQICVHCKPSSPSKLWDRFSKDMAEDYCHNFPNLSIEQAKNAALFEIKKLLKAQGTLVLII